MKFLTLLIVAPLHFLSIIQVPLQSFEIEGEVTDVTPKLRQMAMKDRYCMQKNFLLSSPRKLLYLQGT